MDKIINQLNNIDIKIKNLMKFGILYCFIFTIISCILLVIYNIFNITPYLYYIGIYFFKNSLLFGASFFAFGIFFDKIKKDLDF